MALRRALGACAAAALRRAPAAAAAGPLPRRLALAGDGARGALGGGASAVAPRGFAASLHTSSPARDAAAPPAGPSADDLRAQLAAKEALLAAQATQARARPGFRGVRSAQRSANARSRTVQF
jgi:hypothetical protein